MKIGFLASVILILYQSSWTNAEGESRQIKRRVESVCRQVCYTDDTYAVKKTTRTDNCQTICGQESPGANCCWSLKYYQARGDKPFRIHRFNGRCRTVYSNWCCCHRDSPKPWVDEKMTMICSDSCRMNTFSVKKTLRVGKCKDVCRARGGECCRSLRYYKSKNNLPFRVHYYNEWCNTIYANYCCCYYR